MDIQTLTTCPLGSKCEEIKDNVIHRCAWFIEIKGNHPQTGKPIEQRGCAMTWMPVLLIENSQQQRSTGAAVESFRNEMTQANEINQGIMLAAMTKTQPTIQTIEVKQ